MPNRTAHRARAVALTGLTAAVLGATVLTGTAYAKSSAYVVVGARALRIGQSVQVTAYGGDDSARYTYTCLDERVGNGSWFALGCSARPWASYGRTVRASSFGRIQFRARLLAKSSPNGSARLDRVSDPVGVFVH